MSSNQDQIDYWNGPTGEKWAKYQSEMDRNLADATAGLLKLAAPKPLAPAARCWAWISPARC